MMQSMVKPLFITLLAALLTVGCQSNPSQSDDGGYDSSGGTGSSQDDASRTRTEAAIFGAVIGGLIGGAIGDDGTGVAIGAALGAGAGYLIGDEVAKRKQKYAREEDFLDAEIASARQYNATTAQYNEKMRGEIAQLDKRTRLLESRYKAGLASRNELESERGNVRKQIASAKKVQDNVKKEYDIKVAVLKEQKQKRGAGSPYVKQLEKEIAELKANMDRLEAQSVQLAQLDDRLTL
jgi:hypothetical protein